MDTVDTNADMTGCFVCLFVCLLVCLFACYFLVCVGICFMCTLKVPSNISMYIL